MQFKPEPGAPQPRDDRRAHQRFNVDLPTTLTVNGQAVSCRLVDVSASGALVYTDKKVELGDKVTIDLPNHGTLLGKVVRLSKSHIALSFPGLVVVSRLWAEPALH